MQTITITQAEYDVLLERIRVLTLKNRLLEIDVQELKNILNTQEERIKERMIKIMLPIRNY